MGTDAGGGLATLVCLWRRGFLDHGTSGAQIGAVKGKQEWVVTLAVEKFTVWVYESFLWITWSIANEKGQDFPSYFNPLLSIYIAYISVLYNVKAITINSCCPSSWGT